MTTTLITIAQLEENRYNASLIQALTGKDLVDVEDYSKSDSYLSSTIPVRLL